MKVLKRKFKLLIVSYLTIVCMIGVVGQSHGQQYKWSVGSNITQFNYINSEGAPIDFMKSGSGNRFSVGSEFRLLDTTKLVSSTSERAIYFSSRPRLAKLLSLLKYDVSLESNQYNAVGDVQNIASELPRVLVFIFRFAMALRFHCKVDWLVKKSYRGINKSVRSFMTSPSMSNSNPFNSCMAIQVRSKNA